MSENPGHELIEQWNDLAASDMPEGHMPQPEPIAQWAEHYVSRGSAVAFADHVWDAWEHYGPEDEEQSIGEFLTGVLNAWRGFDTEARHKLRFNIEAHLRQALSMLPLECPEEEAMGTAMVAIGPELDTLTKS